jgi:hypothetical protein
MNSDEYHLSFSVDSTVPPTRFIASLSDGTTVYENYPGNPTLLTPWMRLKGYLEENSISLTKLRFQGGGNTHNIPVADAYTVFYRVNSGIGMFTNNYIGIGVFYADQRRLHVILFNHMGEIHCEEDRDCQADHPALIFMKKVA